jgi:hypothetical protein
MAFQIPHRVLAGVVIRDEYIWKETALWKIRERFLQLNVFRSSKGRPHYSSKYAHSSFPARCAVRPQINKLQGGLSHNDIMG